MTQCATCGLALAHPDAPCPNCLQATGFPWPHKAQPAQRLTKERVSNSELENLIARCRRRAMDGPESHIFMTQAAQIADSLQELLDARTAPELSRPTMPTDEELRADTESDALVEQDEEIERLERDVYQLKEAIYWALGERENFPDKLPGCGPWYWRTELRKRSGLPVNGRPDEPECVPGPIEREPPDYIVQCRCGWMGKVSALKSLPDFKRGCPECSVEFIKIYATQALPEKSNPRPCTCHPADNPPRPCPQKFALSECRGAALFAKEGSGWRTWDDLTQQQRDEWTTRALRTGGSP